MKEKTRKEWPVAMHMKCDDIQSLLLDYINGELGEGRSDLVREHIDKCRKCQDTIQDMRLTISLLRKNTVSSQPHLSMKRHRRILRALLHPFQDWMISHHIFISLVIALVLIILVWMAMSRIEVINTDDPFQNAVQVNWHPQGTNMDNRPWTEGK